MGLHTGAHKSKKQHRLEALFNAEFGAQLRGEVKPVEDKPSFTSVSSAWKLEQAAKQRALEEQLEAELARQIALTAPPVIPAAEPIVKPKYEKTHRGLTVVLSVINTKKGGAPYRWLYKAAPGTFQTEAEHLAKLAARKAGLTIHCHIDTIKPALH